MLWLILGSLGLSLATSLVLVPVVRWLAHLVGIVDAPDAERKLHRKPIALGGGVAVLVSVFVAFAAVISYDRYWGGFELEYIQARWYGLFFCAGAMLLVGLVDDKWNMRGRQKLLAQILIISVMIGTGTVVESINLFGYQFNLGPLAYPVTVLWLLIAVNALNLIDGADGVATTAGIFISLGLAVLSWQHGSIMAALVAFCLAGSLIGFLNYNRPPASIFLGDAGSMVIGLFVGVLAVWSSMKSPTLLASAPVAILAIPLFDSSAAVLRRWLTGRSIYATDRAHLHHLLEAKFGHHGMLLMVAGLCTFTTVLAILSTYLKMPWLSGLGVVMALGVLVFTRSFGHAEFRLVVIRLSSLCRSFLISPKTCEDGKTQSSVPLQGTGNWESIWNPLVQFAKERDFARIKIDLNLAWLHEGYHANWSAVRLPDRVRQLQLKIPLFAYPRGKTELICIGRLEVILRGDDPKAYSKLSELAERLMVLRPQIDELLTALESTGSDETESRSSVGVADPLSVV
ncbi:MraY family glycosyltransferase [Stieleria varia]|nr:MraY family glycosyltransferase [Stieleria varia]